MAAAIVADAVLVEDALTIVQQIISAVQAARASGSVAIDPATWAAAVKIRDAGLAQLDTDAAGG